MVKSVLEYPIYTRDLDDLPALITRIFEIGGLFYLFDIFKAICESQAKKTFLFY